MSGAVFTDMEVFVAQKVKRKSGNNEKKKKKKKKVKSEVADEGSVISDSMFLTGLDVDNREVLPPAVTLSPLEDENVLKLPDELIDFRKNLKTPPQTRTQLCISKSLEGLPGRLDLNPVITKKYFGQKARTHFFDRYKWIDQQMQITQLDKAQETKEFFFNGEVEAPAIDNTYAFAPQRPELNDISKQLNYGEADDNDDNISDDENEDLVDSEQLLQDTISVYKNMSLSGKVQLPSEIEISHRIGTAGGSIRHDSIASSVSSLQDSELDELEFLDSLGILPMAGNNKGSLPMAGNNKGSNTSHRNKFARIKKVNKLPSVYEANTKLSSFPSNTSASATNSLASKYSDYSNSSLASNNPSNDFLLNTMAIPNSPRTTYLVGCAKLNILPRPSLILRKNLTKTLDLQHQGMGDLMATVLAESMKELPYIQSINLKDNNLSCTGLVPIFNVIAHIPNLLCLDVGYNNLGNGYIYNALIEDILFILSY